jgi:hypothetical protein
MKHLSALLLLALCATASAQTIKSLGYNTTNGEVVANTGTNFLRFTNTVYFPQGSTSQYSALFGATNVGIWFTNNLLTIHNQNNSLTLSTALTSGNFSGSFTVSSGSSISFSGGAQIAQTRTNLGLGATWLTNTNATNFRTAIGLGAWATHNDGAAVRSENLTISDGEQLDYIQFTAGTGVAFYGNRASQFRTALGLGWSALTNTNAATFQGALFSATNAAPTNTNAPTPDAWVDIQVGTNTYKLPLWQ